MVHLSTRNDEQRSKLSVFNNIGQYHNYRHYCRFTFPHVGFAENQG